MLDITRRWDGVFHAFSALSYPVCYLLVRCIYIREEIPINAWDGMRYVILRVNRLSSWLIKNVLWYSACEDSSDDRLGEDTIVLHRTPFIAAVKSRESRQKNRPSAHRGCCPNEWGVEFLPRSFPHRFNPAPRLKSQPHLFADARLASISSSGGEDGESYWLWPNSQLMKREMEGCVVGGEGAISLEGGMTGRK